MSTSKNFSFPFQPYEIQQSFMVALYKILVNKKIGIFESPTGTGKSLSLLCATLKFIKDHEEKVEEDLMKSINILNREILSCLDKRDDWIEVQYEVIQKKRELLNQQSKLDKIKKFNNKILNIRNKIQEKERKIILKQKVIEVNDNLLDVDNQETEENDEFLISNIESDSDEAEELSKDEDLFEPLQVFFCSRTHSQLSQLVAEVKSTIYSKDLRSVTLASRQNYCINKTVRQLQNNNLINEKCLELQKSKSKVTKKDEDKNATKTKKIAHNSCPFFKKNLESLRNLSLTKIMDIEELVKSGVDERSCPYYSSRAAMSDSQIIFLPYQILFSKSTRKQCGIKLKDSIVIIDEAHNLMDTISQIHSATVTLPHLKICHTQLMNYKLKYVKKFAAKNLLKLNQLIFITKQLMKFLEANSTSFKAYELYEVLSDASICNIDFIQILKFCEDTRFAQKVHGYSKIHEKLQAEQAAVEEFKKNATKNFLLELQEKSKKKPTKTKEITVHGENLLECSEKNQTNVLRILIQFIECLSQRYEGSRVLVSCNEKTKETSMKFLLLDPSNPFEELVKGCRSIILAGGTMKPTDELTEQMFKNCKERVEIHSFGHVIPSSSILPVALSHGCSGKEFLFTHVNKNCKIMLNEAAITIRNICSIVPGGVVCFFTSYENLNRFYSHICEGEIIDSIKSRKDVFLEPRNCSKTEKVLEDYARSIKQKTLERTGAIIFSVIGGKLSEGMNFSDDLGRCVIVVGVPFPNKTSPELVEKLNYINKNLNHKAGSEYYENLCMKAVNQSIGRAIRHIGDYATVVLLDSRYQRQNILQKLPEWIRKNILIEQNYGKVHRVIATFFKST